MNRGFIVPDEECDCDSGECTDNSCKNVASRDASDEPRSTSAIATLSSQKVKVPCWTVLYSACDKNGDIKTGECYSNAINTRAAKADCYAKLERCGYTNISILAIEAGDPDSCGCEDLSSLEQKATKAQADKEAAELTAEEEEVQSHRLQQTCRKSRISAVPLEQDIGQPSGNYRSDDTENRVNANYRRSLGEVVTSGFLKENRSPFIDCIPAHIHKS